MIHICRANYLYGEELERYDLQPCEKTLAAYKWLEEIEDEPEFYKPYPGKEMTFEVIEKPDGGCVVFAVEIGKDAGVLMLVLSGFDSEAEQKFCISFQARTWGKRWSLPVPPLEIESRPLLYYVSFQLNNDPTAFADAISDHYPLLNAYGMAVIQSQRELYEQA
jgi:hypothetical protein